MYHIIVNPTSSSGKGMDAWREIKDILDRKNVAYKVYAEPLLFGIERDCPEYLEAKRLLKLLDYLLPMPADGIPNNSLLREFVGGSCFNV